MMWQFCDTYFNSWFKSTLFCFMYGSRMQQLTQWEHLTVTLAALDFFFSEASSVTSRYLQLHWCHPLRSPPPLDYRIIFISSNLSSRNHTKHSQVKLQRRAGKEWSCTFHYGAKLDFGVHQVGESQSVRSKPIPSHSEVASKLITVTINLIILSYSW